MPQSEEHFPNVLMSPENGFCIFGHGLVGQAVAEQQTRDDTCPDEEESNGQGDEGKVVLGLEEAGGAGKHVDLWRRVRGRLDVVTDFGESGGLGDESRRRRRHGSHGTG